MKKALMNTIAEPVESHSLKVTVIGVGNVGMAVSMALVTQKICSELALIDVQADRVLGEAMDLEEAAVYTGCRILSGTDYGITENSKLIIITAGTIIQEGESKIDWANRNIQVMKEIVPKCLEYNKDTIILVVTSPVDILTYAVWKISGLPQNLVLGTGTTLDSARFRNKIASRLGVHPKSVHGFIIGEHGQNSVPVWSSVSVGGVRLIDVESAIGTAEDPEDWKNIYEQVKTSGAEIMRFKKKTCWSVSLCVARISAAIVRNTCEVLSVSTLVKDCDIALDKEVFMSIPCVVGKNGIISIIKETLTDSEKESILDTVNYLHDVQSHLAL